MDACWEIEVIEHFDILYSNILSNGVYGGILQYQYLGLMCMATGHKMFRLDLWSQKKSLRSR